MSVIEFPKKKLQIVNPLTKKVGVNYCVVKYLERLSDKITRLHFLDGSYLDISKDLKETYSSMTDYQRKVTK